jgi:hypothetical protein
MKLLKWLGLLAALHAAPSWAQETAHSAHQGSKSDPSKSQPAAPSSSLPASGYRSAFSDYRPFVPDEPMKNWRSANDEVRDAGDHVAPMKGDKPARPGPDAPKSEHIHKGEKP